MTEAQKLIDQFISNHKKLFPNKGEQTITISLITNKKNEIMNIYVFMKMNFILKREFEQTIDGNSMKRWTSLF